jgi:hypothetical protein
MIAKNATDCLCFITCGYDDGNYDFTSVRYHYREDGRLRDKNASRPQVRPASDTITGTNSSHIHAVPHSEIHRLERYAKATSATGRVKRPSTNSTPREISVTA